MLSLSSIFLCGAMVTYVGNTQNYKKDAEDMRSLNQTLTTELAGLYQMLEAKDFQATEQDKKKDATITQLLAQLQDLRIDKRTAETQRDEYEARVAAWGTTVAGFETTIENLNKILELSKNELKILRDKSIKGDAKLNELDMQLYEKIVLMEQLEAELRNISEQKTAIEDRLSGLAAGPEDVSGNIVTVIPNKATPAPVIPAGAALKGLITGVGESMVSVGLGSADGVKPGMSFYVIRGDMFICTLKVTDVEVDKCVGTLQLVTAQPKIGDSVSTEL